MQSELENVFQVLSLLQNFNTEQDRQNQNLYERIEQIPSEKSNGEIFAKIDQINDQIKKLNKKYEKFQEN